MKNQIFPYLTLAALLLVGPSSTARAQSAPPVAVDRAPTPAQRLMGDIAPKLADLTDSVLFGDVWERPQLSKRDRSLVTVSALIAMNRPDQLRSHLARARENGLTELELVETITHLAFYSGWPNAVTAVAVAREVQKQELMTRIHCGTRENTEVVLQRIQQPRCSRLA